MGELKFCLWGLLLYNCCLFIENVFWLLFFYDMCFLFKINFNIVWYIFFGCLIYYNVIFLFLFKVVILSFLFIFMYYIKWDIYEGVNIKSKLIFSNCFFV